MFVNFDEHIAQDCLQTIISLREKGVSCEIYPTKSKLKKQLDYANQREIPFVVMIAMTVQEFQMVIHGKVIADV